MEEFIGKETSVLSLSYLTNQIFSEVKQFLIIQLNAANVGETREIAKRCKKM